MSIARSADPAGREPIIGRVHLAILFIELSPKACMCIRLINFKHDQRVKNHRSYMLGHP